MIYLIYIEKIKDKERILKAARKKQLEQGSYDKVISWFLKRNTTHQEGLAWSIPSNEKQGP